MLKHYLLAPLLAASMLLAGCTGLARMLDTTAGPPPQAPAAFTNISRTALDFALNAFDAALYGLDFAMDAGRLQPGSDNARRIAAIGRRVMNFLGAAEAARDLGNSATYEQAFANAQLALTEFRQLLPQRASLETDFAAGWVKLAARPMTARERERILARLVAAPQA